MQISYILLGRNKENAGREKEQKENAVGTQHDCGILVHPNDMVAKKHRNDETSTQKEYLAGTIRVMQHENRYGYDGLDLRILALCCHVWEKLSAQAYECL